ncbi:MAG TPA: glycoside hydrolase family 15 protein [Solirubrobacteraceae bacterium]|nr:glycoside hydrolase family 15 protein [Solirubrobacteraceae bacterium]
MPVDRGPRRLIRRLVGVRGSVEFRLQIEPRFDYSRLAPTVERRADGAVFKAPGHVLALAAPVKLEPTEAGARAEFELSAGEMRTFVLQSADQPAPLSERDAEHLMHETALIWRNWLGQSSYEGRWRELAHRSALTLKLLSYEPNGAIVAATTASLPERIGGERNWDYRYAWVRDFAFSIYALSRLGFTAETAAFNTFRRAVSDAATPHDGDGPIRVMYRVDGASLPDEQALQHLEGYRRSRPVRIGEASPP